MICVSQAPGSSVMTIHFSHGPVVIGNKDAAVLARLLTYATKPENITVENTTQQLGMSINTSV